MAITQERKNEIIKEYRVHETDTGSRSTNRCFNREISVKRTLT